MAKNLAPSRPVAGGEPLQAVALRRASAWLDHYSVGVLRVCLGLVFLVFGVMKFFPGLSPVAGLAVATIDKLTFGAISGTGALMLTAVMESIIGLTMITGRFVRVGLVVLAVALVGIMSPLVLFFRDLVPRSGPTLTAQYLFKDIVLAAAGLVVAARTLGGRPQAAPADLPGEREPAVLER